MVTVGAAGAHDLTLWIVAEQRYAPTNYPTAVIASNDLRWNWNTRRSDYSEVFAQKVEDGGGKGWVVEAAHPFANLPFSRLTPGVLEDIHTAEMGLRAPYMTRL